MSLYFELYAYFMADEVACSEKLLKDMVAVE